MEKLIAWQKALQTYREGDTVYIEFNTGHPDIVSKWEVGDIGVKGGVEIFPVTRRWAVHPLDWRRWYSKINSYVVVGSYAKDDDFPCNGCYFLVYVIRRP